MKSIKEIIGLLIIAALFVNTAYAATITSDKLILSKYGGLGETLNIGDRLHLYTYSDGSQVYKLVRPADAARTGAITDITSTYTMPAGTTTAYLNIYIAPTYLDGRDGHDHIIEIKDGSGIVVFQNTYYIDSNHNGLTNFEITPPNTPGTYNYQVREYIFLTSPTTGATIKATGTALGISITVPGASPAVTTPKPTITPTPGVTQQKPPAKPEIIPPQLSQLLSAIWQSIKGLFGLSIQGGAGVEIPVNKPYTTSLSLVFNTPDSDYTDGKYQAVFGEWFLADSAMTVKQESGWVELKTPPYAASATITPTAAGKLYLVGVIVRQDYTWDAATQKWSATETIETKEVQELNVIDSTPKPPTVQKPILAGLFAAITAFLKSLGLW